MEPSPTPELARPLGAPQDFGTRKTVVEKAVTCSDLRGTITDHPALLFVGGVPSQETEQEMPCTSYTI